MNKKRLKYTAKILGVLLTLFISLLASCQNPLGDSESKEDSRLKTMARLSVSVSKKFARTIIPETPSETEISMIELKKDGTLLKSWEGSNALSSMKNDTELFVEPGTYDFELNLYKDTQLFQSGTLSGKTVSSGENSLVFSTSYVSTGTGSFYITLNWSASQRVGEIKAGLFSGDGTTPVSGYSLSPIAATGTSAFYAESSVPAGTYFVCFEIYDESSTEKINTIEDLIRIVPATETKTTINLSDLNTIYSVTYNLNGGAWKTGFTPLTSRNACRIVDLPGEDDLVLSGYAFEGWLESTDGGTTLSDEALTTIGAGTARDLVLYAKWKKITTLYVSSMGFDSNDGSSELRALRTLETAFGKINDATSDWTIKISGVIDCSSSPEISSLITDANSIIFEGVNDTSTDVLRSDGSNTVLTLMNSVPVKIKNLCISNGGTGLSISGSAAVTIEGSAFTGNSNSGIKISGTSSVEISGSMIGGTDTTDINRAVNGAGIYKDGTGSLLITDSTIKGNVASGSGGGIYVAGGSVIVGEDTVINGNSAATGKGVYVNAGTFTMKGSALISSNNDVCLASGMSVKVDSALSGTAPVATITPDSYSVGNVVLSGTSVGSQYAKFALTPNGTELWEIKNDGTISLSSATGLTVSVPSYTNDDLELAAGTTTVSNYNFKAKAGYSSYVWTVAGQVYSTTTNTVGIPKAGLPLVNVLVLVATDAEGNSHEGKLTFAAKY